MNLFLKLKKASLSWLLVFVTAASVANPADSLCLWYNAPSKNWNEALPVGNGSLGAMIFGRYDTERIQLNEKTFWSHDDDVLDQPNAYKHLKKVRQLLFEGKYKEAEELAQEKIMTPRLPSGTNAYQTLGDLFIRFPEKTVSNYRRSLNLNNAVSQVSYSINKTPFSEEIFCSAPDQVLVIRMKTEGKELLNAFVELNRTQTHPQISVEGQGILMKERAGRKKGVTAWTYLKAVPLNGGKIIPAQNGLEIKQAKECLIVLASASNFRNLIKDPEQEAKKRVRNAISKGFTQLKKAHTQDYSRYFSRVKLNLGCAPDYYFPTNQRLEAYKKGHPDKGLIELLYHYGRYLMISSARSNTLPANLQGIWADGLSPAWNSDYHININLQMNYWLAEPANLPEIHQSLFSFLDFLRERGRKTARSTYNARGFMGNHATDVWGQSAPVGKNVWGLWPMGGAWLCRHLWEHYEFTQDEKFLKEQAYPIMKEAALFCYDYLVKHPKTGEYVAGPSTSPENSFIAPDGSTASICMGIAMDQQIITDLFENCIKASETLGTDKKFRRQLKQRKAQMAPARIGKDGRVMEWPQEFEEKEKGHRHMSHLYALYPGEQFTWQKTPEFMKASKKVIEQRLKHGGGHTGWSRAWMINFFARLREGNTAKEHVDMLLKKSTLPNLFDNHPPFQIDGNFGFTAGVTEMLVQSHAGEIVLLPALPNDWKDGSVRGIRARGAFEIDMSWKNGKIAALRIKSLKGKHCRISFNKQTYEFSTQAGESYDLAHIKTLQSL